MVSLAPTDRRLRVIAGLAIAGAVPLTLGAIFWIVGSALGLASHPGWGGLAQAGVIMMLAGLACGAIVVAAAAGWQRRQPGTATGPGRPVPTPDGRALTPLASPEHQEYLSGPGTQPGRRVQPGQPPSLFDPQPPSMPAYPHPAQPPAYPQQGFMAPYPQGDAMPAYPAPGPDAGYPQPGAPWGEPAVQWAEPGGQQAWAAPPGLGDEEPTGTGRHRSDEQRRDDERGEYGSGRA